MAGGCKLRSTGPAPHHRAGGRSDAVNLVARSLIMAGRFALTDATIVTGDTEGTVLPDRTIVVGADGGIEQVGPTATTPVPGGYRAIDTAGHFVVPGLINAHAHLFSDGRPLPAILLNESTQGLVSLFSHSPVGRRFFKRRTKTNVLTQLRSGVTTIRTVGDVAYEVVAVADEIDRGRYLGPRMLASGPLLAVTGGHGAPQIALIADSPWEARRNTRLNLRHGVKAIKISATGGVTDARTIGQAGRPEMTEEEMTAICEEAHNAGVLVAAHAQSKAGILASLRAGADTIEHGAGMTSEIIGLFLDNPRSLNGTSALIPTLQACLPLVKLDQAVTGINDTVKANAGMVLEEMIQGIQAAQEHGISIGLGTDSALTFVTHYNAWREMDLVVRYGGLTPARALNAATRTNAKILGLDDVTGSIEPGKAADLVVLGSNPLDGFRAFTDPLMVVARGTIIDRPSVTRYPDVDAHLDSF
ncbi:amidohydrolase family protein [Streptomyces sp. NPDC006487]|uniref:amidohydrolase family protein n=1 Tax=Streptomyces sp. NPDC006487 TaxID=3364748 RepID=UPI0036D15BA8